MINKIKYINLTLSVFLLSGCSYYQFDKTIQNPNLPQKYNESKIAINVEDNWLVNLNNKELIYYTQEALNNNYTLRKKALDVKIQEQKLISSNSLLFPTLDLKYTHDNDGKFDSSASSTLDNLSLEASYEIDVWGKLSDNKKSEYMTLLENQALYEDAKQSLVNETIILYYEIIKLSQLEALYKQNLKNAQDNFNIIESKYNKGLQSALDVYLAKQSLFAQQQKLTINKTQQKQAIHNLEKLIGQYPKGLLSIKQTLPLIKSTINTGVPEQLILRKPTILAAWNALLAKDHTLAFKHKQRLPSFSLTGKIQDNLDGSTLSWSLLGGITAPLFNAGDLEAQQKVAEFEVQQEELNYLDTLYDNFVQIENLIVQEKNLKEEYSIMMQNLDNAKNSFELSLNEYLKGLTEYITVLNSQQTYFSAQESIIDIKMQIITNRFNLHYALGGDFGLEEQTKKDN